MIMSPGFSLYPVQAKMAALWLILVSAVLLQAQADATQVTFSKRNGAIYVETDAKHFAMYGPVTDKNGIRIVAVDEEGQHHLTSRCDTEWTEYKKIGKEIIRKYGLVRDYHLESKGNPDESPADYIWTDSFTENDKPGEQKVIRQLDGDTFVYTSEYFPSFLARVIISGNVVIYVKHKGEVTMKTLNCLFINEKIFIEGILKINPDKKKIPLLSSKIDKVFKNYLKSKNFETGWFELEVDYSKTYTKEELAAMQRAVRGGGVRSFDGWKDNLWDPR